MARNYVDLFESAEKFLGELGLNLSDATRRGKIALLVHNLYKVGFQHGVNDVKSRTPLDLDCAGLEWVAVKYTSAGIEALRKTAKSK